jgi:hypothetical protein
MDKPSRMETAADRFIRASRAFRTRLQLGSPRSHRLRPTAAGLR